MRVREAVPSDVLAVDRLVRALAAYEREPDAVAATPEDLHRALFGAGATTHCNVAETDVDGIPSVIGIALWYVTYSTWTGQQGIWLEDLFVLPEHRGSGAGRALLAVLAATCVSRGWRRLEWWVLDWNEPAHHFYRSIGARAQDEWTVWRLDGEALGLLATAPR